MRWLLLLGVLAAGPAIADTTFVMIVSNRVTEVQPSATVEVWAVFDEDLFAFAGAAFDVVASPDSGGFSDPYRRLDGPGTHDGEVAPDGDSVTGIIAGQLTGCPVECPPDRSNPMLIWGVTWSTGDFTPRTVDVGTATSKFDVYIDNTGASASFLDDLVEGWGVIEVGCYADCTGDRQTDLFDFLCFIGRFNGNAHEADCDNSGSLDIFDFLCFVNVFQAGC